MLAEVLQDNGYATVAFSQLMDLSFRRGFDEYTWRDGEWETGPVDRDLESTLKEMQEWVGRQAQPFFLFMHTYQVHLGYKPLEKYKRRFVSPYYDGPLRDLDITENLMREMAARGYPAEELTDDDRDYVVALYDAELAHLDDVIGRFLDSLDRLGLSDNTLVVVLSDHGEEFGERGYMARHGTLYDEVIRTPLIIAGPGVPVGREFNQPVRNIDIAPTLLSLAGLEIPEVWQGSSLEPIWTGSEQESREVFSENPNWDDATLIIDRLQDLRQRSSHRPSERSGRVGRRGIRATAKGPTDVEPPDRHPRRSVGESRLRCRPRATDSGRAPSAQGPGLSAVGTRHFRRLQVPCPPATRPQCLAQIALRGST